MIAYFKTKIFLPIASYFRKTQRTWISRRHRTGFHWKDFSFFWTHSEPWSSSGSRFSWIRRGVSGCRGLEILATFASLRLVYYLAEGWLGLLNFLVNLIIQKQIQFFGFRTILHLFFRFCLPRIYVSGTELTERVAIKCKIKFVCMRSLTGWSVFPMHWSIF